MTTLPRGRPRDPALDRAIAAATVGLLMEIGYRAMSLELVARRAGVARASIYRRWRTKAHLVYETVFTELGPRSVPDHGDLETDLIALIDALRTELSAPAAAAAINGVLADFAADEAFRAHVRDRFLAPTAAALRQVLHRAARRGEVAADAPADLLVQAIGGTVFFRAVVLGVPLDETETGNLVRIVLDGVRSRGRPAQAGAARLTASE
ncbi:TetR family transcriptional regulator [Planobispora rosea]|uniref:TetR family transcriptional regulator n=1 Tax=Planobispora rosea TaxID=35762 RepID=A0A8J3SA90_PLARO|nr:TetR/AcrR family transcriptional regulator [Planobispora rosea]GGT05522.1 TetR family transcriptional regulator [Planobispora rosea]GIH88947.1 TetR family transcriptional regulator [Planobispora rosea]